MENEKLLLTWNKRKRIFTPHLPFVNIYKNEVFSRIPLTFAHWTSPSKWHSLGNVEMLPLYLFWNRDLLIYAQWPVLCLKTSSGVGDSWHWWSILLFFLMLWIQDSSCVFLLVKMIQTEPKITCSNSKIYKSKNKIPDFGKIKLGRKNNPICKIISKGSKIKQSYLNYNSNTSTIIDKNMISLSL